MISAEFELFEDSPPQFFGPAAAEPRFWDLAIRRLGGPNITAIALLCVALRCFVLHCLALL